MASEGIGVLGERHLHAALKEWYREEGDRLEVEVGGFVIDLVRDGRLIEIQTRGFSAMRRKFDRLLDQHSIRLVHPIPATKWIRRHDENGTQISRRKSPKKGLVVDVCEELVSFPSLLSHPNFSLEVLLIEEEEVQRPDKGNRRRRGWGLVERRFLSVLESQVFCEPDDLLRLLPSDLPDPFTTADIAGGMSRSRHVAQELAYCLREAGVVSVIGRTRNGIEYRLPAMERSASAAAPQSEDESRIA